VLMEMKYGDGALGGKAGFKKHLVDINKFFKSGKYSNLCEMIEKQFNQLNELGLIKFNKSKLIDNVGIKSESKPEVIFILANHNPRSSKLISIISDPEVETLLESAPFDLKYYVSTFAGYGMHSESMLSHDQFKKLLTQMHA